MKANARDIRTALERPSPDIRLYLLHGPDGSAAADLAGLLARAMGPEAERIDLDGATLRCDPARLADEAASLSLFGGARHIRVAPAGEECLDAFTTLLAADHAGNPVVALAPTVKSTAKIVKLAIESRRALAYAAYEPSAADLERLAATMARDAGLRPAPGVAARLAASCGGDRLVLGREIDKLALFLDAAPDRPHDADEAALDAIGADLGEAEMTQVVDAVISGQTALLGAELGRLHEAGTSPIPWLRLLARRLMTLAEMKAEIDAGAGQDSVFKRHRIFFREEAATAQALRRWTPAMLATALLRVRHAERAIMASGNAGGVLADHALTELTRGVERRG
ncbi:DNA polymerase III subunit delta [Sphingomonas sp. CV7422]|uniref:DNA polymerase III subunit delta n=1 Tax=Sphingomonas sp. CV7422 TaxID=3018036 RepID=UPI0022FE9CE6|nr:DNA polymerase III subunit delta [Sphingomonas sp. CV7422]